jgi:hypothetical protein
VRPTAFASFLIDSRRHALAEIGFPTKIDKRQALEQLGEEAIKWFLDHEVLSATDNGYYGLVDEFLRIRFILRDSDSNATQRQTERSLIQAVSDKWYL